MSGVSYVVRAVLRRRWRALVAIGLLFGIGAGLAIACVAGGRRTSTAFDRFIEASNLGEYEFGPYTEPGRDFLDPEARLASIEAAKAMPQVARSAAGSFVFHGVEGEPASATTALVTIVALDADFLHTLNTPRVVDGRLPDPDKAFEMAIDEQTAAHRNLEVGDHLSLVGISVEQVEDYFSGQPIDGEGRRFTVTGIVRYPADLTGSQVGSDEAFLTPAYWDRYGKDLAHFGPGVAIDLEPGQAKAFEQAIRADPTTRLGSLDTPDSAVSEDVDEATRVQSTALLILAAVLAIASMLLAGQALIRHLAFDQGEAAVLHAIGLDRSRQGLAQLARVAFAAALAVVVAVAVAVAASPAFPVGIARKAEPEPGIDVDVPVLLGGAVLTLLALLVIGAIVIAVVARRRAATDRPSRLAGLAGRGIVPVAAGLGIGFALRPGRGTRAVPVRTVIGTAVIGLLVVVGAFGFVAGLDRLIDDPERYGWSFDVVTGTNDDGDTFDDVLPLIEEDERIGDITVTSVLRLGLANGGGFVTTMGWERVRGGIEPVVVAGRLPKAPGEIALGRRDQERAGAGIGGTVTVTDEADQRRAELRVVGTALFPAGEKDFPGSPGSGALMTLDGLRDLAEEAPRHVYLLRIADGLDTDAVAAELASSFPSTYVADPGPRVRNLDDVRNAPLLVASAIALLAAAALVHAQLTSARRRRHDIALLRTFGMRPSQVDRMLVWQGVTMMAAATLIGLPLGAIAGRVVWSLVARSLGVADDPAPIPVIPVLGVLVAALVIAGVLAAITVPAARRIRPAVALRAE